MKKILLSLFTGAMMITGFGQQMSYYVDMTGNIGDQFIMGIDTAVDPTDIFLNLGDTGATSVWNFQGLDATKYDTINWVPLNAQETTDFPAGNVVVSSGLGRVVFNRNAASGLYLLGTAVDFGGFPVSLNYNPPQRTITSVCSLHTQDSTISFVNEDIYVGIDSTFGGLCHAIVDSIRIKRRSSYHIKWDATGELRLPLDTFNYTLRAITVETTIDSIFIFSTPGFSCPPFINVPPGWSLPPDILVSFSGLAESAVIYDTLRTATWYDPYTISPVCAVDYAFDPGFIDTTWLSVRFKGTNTPDIGFESVEQIALNVYPNPASDVLMLQTSADISNATMYIYNAMGQQVKVVKNSTSNTVDVSELNNGIYFYQLATDKKLMHQGKFIIKR